MNNIFRMLCLTAVVSILPFAGAMAERNQTILTDNGVEVRETISSQGFVHPGISCNAETLYLRIVFPEDVNGSAISMFEWSVY